MIQIYTVIQALAEKLRDSTALLTYCMTNFQNGCMLQIDDKADDPLSDIGTPWVVIAKADPGELGATASHSAMSIRIVCGISVPVKDFIETTPRTTSTNGLRSLDAGKKAEEFMREVVAVCKGVALGSGMLLESASPDVDVYTFAPLQVAACNFTVTQTQSMSTF